MHKLLIIKYLFYYRVRKIVSFQQNYYHGSSYRETVIRPRLDNILGENKRAN